MTLKHWWPCPFQISSPITELIAIQSILLLPIIIPGFLGSGDSHEKSSPTGQRMVDRKAMLSSLPLISSVTIALGVVEVSIKVPLIHVCVASHLGSQTFALNLVFFFKSVFKIVC